MRLIPKRWLVLLTVGAGIALPSTAVTGQQLHRPVAAKSAYTIGYLLSLSGQAAFVGQEAVTGANFAISEINNAGGVNGHHIKGNFQDNQLQPAVGISEVQQMMTVDNTKFFVSQVTPVVLALKQVAAERHVILINPAAVSPSIADGKHYTFTTIADAGQEAPILSAYMIKKLHIHSVATLSDSSAIGEAASSAMAQAIRGMRGQVVDQEYFPVGATDYRAQLTKISAQHPDAVFMSPNGAQGAANILQQAHELGLNVRWFANTFFEDPNVVKLAGSLADGVIYSHVGFDPKRNAKSKHLQSLWAKGNTGVAPIYAVTAYDATHLLADAIKKVGYKPTKVRNYLLKLRNWVGASGTLSFNRRGGVRMPIDLKQVKNGAFVVIQKGK